MRQVQQQQSITPIVVQSSAMPTSSRLAITLGIALVGTLLLTLLAAVLIVFINPLHLAGLLALPAHAPQVYSIPIIEFVLLVIAVRLGSMPFAIYRYLQDVRTAQEQYYQLYTPLTALTNIRQSPSANEQGLAPVIEERVAILDLVQQQDTDQLILGVPGAGKTTALRVYQYSASEHPLDLVFKRNRVPIYVPMKNYSLFLKTYLPTTSENNLPDMPNADTHVSLLNFLAESDLPGIEHVRPYLFHLAQQGRLLLLCDGLNEIDNHYLSFVSHELVHLMRDTQNRLVMTCREVDYREQPEFIDLVNKGQAARATVYPLQTDQINEFVERYVERQDKHWRHTAGQIMQVIDRSRLRYHCTNPMMLFTLMGIIDKIGVERGKQIDTRGRLLRESVKQLIVREQAQSRWNKTAPSEREVVRFLSEVACAARWANDRNAIQLRVATPTGEDIRIGASIDELADELRFWLDEHPPESPFIDGDELLPEPYDDLPQLLQFALSCALIEISPSGVLSFRHELIAEYFVAEYFYVVDSVKRTTLLSIRLDLLENVGRWSESVAIWAGLLDQPLVLAERFGELGRSNPAYVLQALALSLVCVGVLWTPPQAEVQRPIALPQRVAEALAIAVRNKAAREELARIFTRCAEEGGQEVYRSLLPLIMVEGVDDLLILLDQSIVPELLFTQLLDTVDNLAYEVQVKRLTQVLGRFGSVVVSRAAELSQPMSERTTRLRAAAINILGGTADARAVEPLLARISDAEPFIVTRAASALVRLGPECSLTRLLQELENRQPSPFTKRVHQAMLTILARFLNEPDPKRQVTMEQFQRVLESVVPVLTSNYQSEPEVQQQAQELLIQQAQLPYAVQDGNDSRSERVIEALVRLLASQNDMAVQIAVITLKYIGAPATPRLLEVLLQAPQEAVRIRALDILQNVHDPRALPGVLQLLEDTSPQLQQHTVDALLAYAPESIPGLIDVVLTHSSELVAEKASQILVTIGEQAAVPTSEALLPLVPERTRLLVYVLERLRDQRSIVPLMNLLQEQHLDPLLIIAIVRALSKFPDKRIVPALMNVLSDPRPQVYEAAIDALSQLNEVALPSLVSALNVLQENATVQRVQRALLGMTPFPGDALIDMLQYCSDAQAHHIMNVFRKQGPEAAQGLVRNLLYRDERVRFYIQQALNDIPGDAVVPALLDALNQPALLRAVKALLLHYPEEAIPPLVELLGEQERADAAATILPQYGSVILRPLLSGLEDARILAREHAENIVVEMVRQSQDQQVLLRDLVRLFAPPPPPRAHEFLLEVLTNELANVSMPALLEGLEDAHLMNDAADALVRLANKGPHRKPVLDSLLHALYVDERRRGAEEALIKIGAPAVLSVGELIVDPHPLVARSAKNILGKIGVPALALVWQAINDKSNPESRNAALEIFQGMSTSVIKDELVQLLGSDKSEDIAMAVALLLERVRDESARHYADREMIPEMLAYVQAHDAIDAERTNQRIISLLLLLGEKIVLDHLLEALDEEPQHKKQLAYILLLFGPQTHDVLLETFNNPDTSLELRADLATVLGMSAAPDVVTEYAKNLSSYGFSSSRTSILFPKQLVLSHRALGGLLASGQWDESKLRELRDAGQEGSPARELFNELLGWRYEPQLLQLQNQIQTDRETHRQEVVTLTGRIVADQDKIHALEDELEQIKREHGVRGAELDQTAKEKDAIRANFDKITKENSDLTQKVDRLQKENQALQDRINQVASQLNPLSKP
ncbi:MAG: hypothetical protein NVSMB49_13620 [Ktedonobacteraceae bacterium]